MVIWNGMWSRSSMIKPDKTVRKFLKRSSLGTFRVTLYRGMFELIISGILLHKVWDKNSQELCTWVILPGKTRCYNINQYFFTFLFIEIFSEGKKNMPGMFIHTKHSSEILRKNSWVVQHQENLEGKVPFSSKWITNVPK